MKQPRIEVRDNKGKMLRKCLLPSGAHLMVEDGQEIAPGDVLAKIPRETGNTLTSIPLITARREAVRKIFVTGDDDSEKREDQLPRGATSASRKASESARASR